MNYKDKYLYNFYYEYFKNNIPTFDVINKLEIAHNNINIHFDKIYLINMNKRPDRLSAMVSLFKKEGIYNYKRIEGLDGSKDPIYSDFLKHKEKSRITEYEKKHYNRKALKNPGSLGILRTNKNILLDAHANNYKRILILQDDLIFHKDFYNKCNEIFTGGESYDYKLLFLGASQHRWHNIIIDNKKNYYHPITPTEGAFAVGINMSIYEELLEFINNYYIPIDSGALSYIQKKYPNDCYIMYPNIIIADIRDSDLRGARNFQSVPFKWDISLYQL